MNTVLIRERYKVVRVLWSEPDYAFVEAVDIQERETPSRLINLYEGRLLHRYGRICAGIDPAECPAYRGMFLTGETLAVVFDACSGERIDQVFFKGAVWSPEERLDYAERLLHQALALSSLPPAVSCAAMLSENLLVDPGERRFNLRYMVRPLPAMNSRELALLAGDQVKKILPRTFTSLEAQLDFLDQLDAGLFRSMTALYARWRQVKPAIQKEQEEFQNQNWVNRGLALLKLRLKRCRKRRRQP